MQIQTYKVIEGHVFVFVFVSLHSNKVTSCVAVFTDFCGSAILAWRKYATVLIIFPLTFEGTIACPTHGAEPFFRSWNCVPTQELPSILWFTEFHYCVHKSPPLDPMLCQTDPIQSNPSHFISVRSILLLSTHLCLGLYLGLLPSDFPPISFIFPRLPIRPTCPAQRILPDLIILTIPGEEYKLWNSSLRRFLDPPARHLSSVQIILTNSYGNFIRDFSWLCCC